MRRNFEDPSGVFNSEKRGKIQFQMRLGRCLRGGADVYAKKLSAAEPQLKSTANDEVTARLRRAVPLSFVIFLKILLVSIPNNAILTPNRPSNRPCQTYCVLGSITRPNEKAPLPEVPFRMESRL